MVVDGPMVRYHGEGVRHYVLTLMHIVSLSQLMICSRIYSDDGIFNNDDVSLSLRV